MLEKTVLGIEFGSTRIKACLVDEKNHLIASGSHTWENSYENGYWTYSLDAIWCGLQDCFSTLKDDVLEKYGVELTTVRSIGISAMMHGYMPFDKDNNLLVPFRTWRNNNAENSAIALTNVFNYQIPARWSIAHLYQAIMDNESHIRDIDYITTLEGYIHFMLTGEKVIGIGEASGMFPIDIDNKCYNKDHIDKFNSIIMPFNLPYKIEKLLPKIMIAGERAGCLTENGARLLDKSGKLTSGITFCPPEGDAGTGMVATNSISKRSCNVSAGTSIFGMVVLEKELSKVYREIDLVTTPNGNLVGMVHCNNCTSELNAWVKIFEDVLKLANATIDNNTLFEKLFELSLLGDNDCSQLISYNYISGENITNVDNGAPMLLRGTGSNFNLKNFMKAQLYSCFVTLKIGFELMQNEGVQIDEINAHGGLFKTKGVCQDYLAGAINVPVSVMETAGEGGAWGMAVLANYMNNSHMTLEDYLDKVVFAEMHVHTVSPKLINVEGINKYADNFKKFLEIERRASKLLGEE